MTTTSLRPAWFEWLEVVALEVVTKYNSFMEELLQLEQTKYFIRFSDFSYSVFSRTSVEWKVMLRRSLVKTSMSCKMQTGYEEHWLEYLSTINVSLFNCFVYMYMIIFKNVNRQGSGCRWCAIYDTAWSWRRFRNASTTLYPSSSSSHLMKCWWTTSAPNVTS